MNLPPDITLNNGVRLPRIGFGTFKIPDESAKKLVLQAVETGYRHIDTAMFYKNETGVGKALKEAAIPREEIFVTTKVWYDDLGKEKTLRSFKQSLKNLALDYIDLLLLHWPNPKGIESWRVLETLLSEGRLRAIGVSNYTVPMLKDLLDKTDVVPSVNQIELHPELQQDEVCRFCAETGIVVEAWSPIMKGQVTEIPLLREIGAGYGKTSVQVTLRWHLQNNLVILPKASSKERMQENIDIFDFELTPDEMSRIAALNRNRRTGPDPEVIYRDGFNR